MPRNVQIEQINFHALLKGIDVRNTEKLYVNENSAKSFHPESSQQDAAVVRGAKPELTEKLNSEEESQLHGLLSQFVESVRKVDQRREQSLLEMQQVAIELAVAAASHLAYTVIEEDQFGIEDMVQSLFDSADTDPSFSIVINPEDLELLERRLSVTTAYPDLRKIEFSSDHNLARGSCKFQTNDKKSWLTSISLKLSELRKHWLEELDASQIERRETQGTNSSLRRFPDRREIA